MVAMESSAPALTDSHQVSRKTNFSIAAIMSGLQARTETEAKLESIVARQTPDADKLKKADVVIDTGCSKEETLRSVEALVRSIRAGEGGFVARTFAPQSSARRE